MHICIYLPMYTHICIYRDKHTYTKMWVYIYIDKNIDKHTSQTYIYTYISVHMKFDVEIWYISSYRRSSTKKKIWASKYFCYSRHLCLYNCVHCLRAYWKSLNKAFMYIYIHVYMFVYTYICTHIQTCMYLYI